MKKIRAGIIGSGFIGPVHAEAVRRTGIAEVAAISEVNEDLACAKARELGIDKAYGDYHALLADPEIDCVHICVPNHLHYMVAQEAIRAGKHIVGEKPLAMDAQEGEALVRLVAESGLVNGMHLNIRAYPLVEQVRDMVANGDLGTIFAINGSYQQDWLFKETDYSWRLEPEYCGRSRAVADIGTHWFDTVEYATGLRAERVCADFATFHKTRKKPLRPVETYSGKLLTEQDYVDFEVGTEDYATVLLHFNNGAHGSFTANQVAAGRKNRLYFEIYGSKRAVAFDSEQPNALWIGNRDTSNELMIKDPSLMYARARTYSSYPGGHTEGYADATKQTMLRIYQDIASGKRSVAPNYPTFADGLRELRICEAVCRSAEEEKWVNI